MTQQAMQQRQLENARGPVDIRRLTFGLVLTAVGGVLGTAGAVFTGSALLDAVKRWAITERNLERRSRATAAMKAGADIWRGAGPREITLPEAERMGSDIG